MPAEPVKPVVSKKVVENVFNHPKVQYKVVDLGNSCWTTKKFTENIQTRQYRAPEVLMHAGYDTSTDIWSVACMIFELLTGDYLFDPCHDEGRSYTKDEDHLALIIELIGKIPKKMIDRCKRKNYFTKCGNLKNIKKLKFWPLQRVLQEKYSWSRLDAANFVSFMEPMLEIDPAKRITAREALNHPWLEGLPHPSILHTREDEETEEDEESSDENSHEEVSIQEEDDFGSYYEGDSDEMSEEDDESDMD